MNKKRIIFLVLCLLCAVSLVGCSFKKKNEEKEESSDTIVAQNDYAGAYSRVCNIQNDVLNAMSQLEENNLKVQTENPDDYWSDDQFYFLHFLPVFTEELGFTEMLNENDKWEEVQKYIQETLVNSGLNENSVSVIRKDMNHYVLRYANYFVHPLKMQSVYGEKEINIIYDASSNSFRVTSYILFQGDNDLTFDFFYEFAEIAPYIYVLQNNEERLYVEYEKELPDASIPRQIKYFAYSDLMKNDNVIPSNANTAIDEDSNTEESADVSTDNAAASCYNVENDSIFKNLAANKPNRDWATSNADNVFEKTIVFEPTKTIISSTNILTKEKSIFTIRTTKTNTEDGEISTMVIEKTIEEAPSLEEVTSEETTFEETGASETESSTSDSISEEATSEENVKKESNAEDPEETSENETSSKDSSQNKETE